MFSIKYEIALMIINQKRCFSIHWSDFFPLIRPKYIVFKTNDRKILVKTHQDFLDQFIDERKPIVEAMLKAIREQCPNLSETIKWNAPTFCFGGKDRMTVMLHKKDRVGLILHTGAKPKEDKKAPHFYFDDTELLEWNSNIRATISFFSLSDFFSKSDRFKRAINRWIEETKDL
jgi:hypothetical protein